MAAQKLKEWQKAENKEVPPEELQEDFQAKDSGHTHKEGPNLFSTRTSQVPRWKQGQLTPEAPGRETLRLPSGTNDLPT